MSTYKDDIEFASYMGMIRLLSKIELDNYELIQERLKDISNPNMFVVFRTEEEASKFHKFKLPAYLIYIEDNSFGREVRIKFDTGDDKFLCSIEI